MAGLLAQILGEDPSKQKAKLEEAKVNANDLSGLVRKKKPKPAASNGAAAPAVSAEGSSNGKRKLEDVVESDQEGKKVKLDG
jgi:HAT1-interacting factor 1